MYREKKLIWHSPLELAHSISRDSDYKENWTFLYSSLSEENPNSISYLALYPAFDIIEPDFKKFESALKNNNKLWFGYLGYDLKNHLEKLKIDSESLINLPNLWMINYNLVLKFNHRSQRISCFYTDTKFLKKIPLPLKIKISKLPKITQLKSNFSKAEYFKKLFTIKKHIDDGDLYQANLTRKFFGKFSSKPKNIFDLFIKLNSVSPSNYSAFLKLDKNFIISSSPELFLSIKNNLAISRPIKGTTPRFSDSKLDLISKNILKNSSKEKAENLMIVDLVRNDLSRNCLVNSVKIKNLFKVSSYKNVHHLSSDIYGIKDDKYSNLDLVKSCFPPASMTGAPKIKAMEVCSNLELKRRGIYSGAIGFFNGANHCELSVVIRTIIIQNQKLEFQVGGAITFDSDPKKEWQEVIVKAKGIAKALCIKLSDLKKI